ncbi:leucine-rich repeat domain-containing protein [Neochlamydia sp. EPS4]|uniref:leucine-rich repeat domain-containing protein n=1 Tax=Neochlamydia sp. EPS4 TaxID=1478175 RepID=UPI0006941C4D|nr:leucine-rich repeat domain-containing protein [Neochlamydia sp. EPS4]
MNPSSSITIEHLPNEILLSILKKCASPSLFSVGKRWHHLLTNEVMPSLYKKIGKVHVPQGNFNKQALILDKTYRLEIGLSKVAKVNVIFKQIFALANSLSPLELEFKWVTKEKRYFTFVNYTSYLLNINRLLMWNTLPGGSEYLEQEKIKYLSLEKKGELFKKWIERRGKDITGLEITTIGLTFLPSEIQHLSKLKHLNLENNKLTFLPKEIGQLTQLQKLTLNNNQLTSLPAEIGQLSTLIELNINDNYLTSLPSEIKRIAYLQDLDLGNNQFAVFPLEITHLVQLKWLFLQSNQLTSLPAEIKQLSQLEIISLDHNQLTFLPAEIGQLSQLEIINLDHNQLTSLPAELRQLSYLENLSVISNQIDSLPAELGQLPKGVNFNLKENPLKSIPNEIKQRFNP